MGLSDDVAYAAILLGSIGLGRLVRAVPPERNITVTFTRRKLLSTGLGIGIACLVSGWHVLHLAIQAAGNAAILLTLSHRHCHLASFAWCFSYLFLFRLSVPLGLPAPPPHTNAIIMILTLKLVGLAFEVHDVAVEREKEMKNAAKEEGLGLGDDGLELASVNLVPSLADQIHYGFNHVGLITGPYYRYSTWLGLTKDPWNPAVAGEAAAGVCETAAGARAARLPGYVLAFLLSGYLFPLDVTESADWHAEHGALYKMLYMLPIFFAFRMRIYSGFVLSECSCIMAGLGAYPASSRPRPGQGPTLAPVHYSQGDEVNFETVHNIDEWGSDFVPSMREALRCWNMTVQHWLVLVVYKRFPVRGLRTAAVMLVSSVWHGVHPGYYLGLCSVPLCLAVEDLWRRRVRARLEPAAQRWYDWAAWIVRMRWFDYLGMAFLLLRIDTTLMYWTSVYFVGHLSLPVLAVLAVALEPLLPRREQQAGGAPLEKRE